MKIGTLLALASPLVFAPPVLMQLSATSGERFNDNVTLSKCHDEYIAFDPFKHKPVYTIGVHSIRGYKAAMTETAGLFEEYLSKTVGRRFEPPIQFDVLPSMFEKRTDHENMDFFYA